MSNFHDLIILATPIGNLNEANQLLIDSLENLNILFCEDTRVTKQLLNLLNIKNNPELISFHKFNENNKLNQALEYLQKEDCGLISDAGYPTISDPGYSLVKLCHENEIKVKVVNGSCAINHAIAQSGFCSHGYVFIGFVSKKEKEVIETLNYYAKMNLPIVFFVSVHQVNDVIGILKQHFSDDEIYIGRELTKKFETYYVGLVNNIPEQVNKGEFCFILNKHLEDEAKDLNDLVNEFSLLVSCNIKPIDACKYLSKKFNVNKNDLYKKLVNIKK